MSAKTPNTCFPRINRPSIPHNSSTMRLSINSDYNNLPIPMISLNGQVMDIDSLEIKSSRPFALAARRNVHKTKEDVKMVHQKKARNGYQNQMSPACSTQVHQMNSR